ncbi:hypothetical protein BDV96DRAFT_642451 [Lophiotrema nucula]|uniref:Uncharacterized protein n=1 Tax=Lophiotrema nucula TaxID=690887 RepID=A0A6A5ZJX3_9PLEO|nr:hypothetical protein BDV96DRAFT_642451 [Lophiotrema nucula]
MGSTPLEPIAIIGAGCRFPGQADSPSRLWDLLQNPVDLSKRIPDDRFNPTTFFNEDGEHHGASNVDKGYFLEENIREFDASFFNIAPKEAETIDPQHRILLETVYEGLDDAGLSMQKLQGSNTSVYVGCMTMDYYDMQYRDPQLSSQYVATGTASSILSNRVSYFYNWSGPSMTIDTACSSSLVAVHLAVQSLRSGESSLACAAGANLILGPERFIAQSSLHMLSPTGKSRMWDEGADGYARGEGIACVFLKKLSDALADGDHIDGIIRETGVNSDGRSKGITMPSSAAQAQLIRETYARAGLNPCLQNDRPQVFEAHGTGTQAGDPREANAISSSFFAGAERSELDQKLIVGSIKTIIGHTEGAAGLAGVIKMLVAMKHRTVPPNQHLVKLNPSVEPFYGHLHIPTSCMPWPNTHGGPMRASVNSFGFGGTNAHAILESFSYSRKDLARWMPSVEATNTTKALNTLPSIAGTPLLITGMTDKALRANAKSLLTVLQTCDDDDFACIIWTLRHRRSHLPVRSSISGVNREQIVAALERRLGHGGPSAEFGLRSKNVSRSSAKILGVFTGQGAQWATMARSLLASPLFARTLQQLQAHLDALPDPPSWSIVEQLQADAAVSRLNEAALSQPLCTCLQIALIEMLRESGVNFHTVVGHSSGEIGAAYAAGLLSARDAVCIAYYRGVHAKLAQGPEGRPGGMLAIGLGIEEAQAFCAQSQYRSRLAVAASNSSTSATLSGDLDAVQEAFQDCSNQGLFARPLKVDTAYHSMHMYPCSQPYLDSLDACGVTPLTSPTPSAPRWFSSVTGVSAHIAVEMLSGTYWRDNMCQPVLFAEATSNACAENGPFDLIMEVGPHPALKGPTLQTVKSLFGSNTPYTGTLDRTKNDMMAFSEAIASVWTHLGGNVVDLKCSDELFGSMESTTSIARGLPSYSWDHSQPYWRAFRVNRQFLNRTRRPHELLGIRTNDDTENEMRWRNILKPDEIKWLHGHRFQGQIIVPAAAYCIMAFEAAKAMAGNETYQVIELQDVNIASAITMRDDSAGIEVIFTLKHVAASTSSDGSLEAEFILQSGPVDSDRPLKTSVSGRVLVTLGELDAHILPSHKAEEEELRAVDIDEFYDYMQDIGLSYTGPFRSITNARRRYNRAHVTMPKRSPEDTTSLPVSPALLDSCLQAGFIAYSAPGDQALWTPFLPKYIKSIKFNSFCCESRTGSRGTSTLDVEAYVTGFDGTNRKEAAKITSDIEIYNEKGQMEFLLEGVVVASFSKGSEADDRELYLKTVWKPDALNDLADTQPYSIQQCAQLLELESMAKSFLKKIRSRVINGSTPEVAQIVSKLAARLDLTSSDRALVSDGVLDPLPERTILTITGENLSSLWQIEAGLVRSSIDNELLHQYFTKSITSQWASFQLQKTLAHIAHRYARINILEISNGYGSFADAVTSQLGRSFATYTACAPSIESLSHIQSTADPRVLSRTFAFEEAFSEQGLRENFYDVVIVNDFLHAAASPDLALRGFRGLMRPGSYLILAEPTSQLLYPTVIACGLSDLWPEESARNRFGRDSSISIIDKQLVEASLSGVTHVSFDTGDAQSHTASLIVSQAVEEVTEKLQCPLNSRDYNTSQGALLIIGGSQLGTAKLARKVTSFLQFWEAGIIQADTFEELDSQLLSNVDLALVLADLDSNVLEDLSEQALSSMQSLFGKVKTILWITSGANESNPYHSATTGLGRAVWGEQAELRLQFLDIDNPVEHSIFIVEALLRLKISGSEAYAEAKPLWTTERELIFRNGKLLIPRMFPDTERNQRLNSQRRVIRSAIDLNAEVVELKSTADAPLVPHQGTPISLLAVASTDHILIKVKRSSSVSVEFHELGRLWLVSGTTMTSGEEILAFAPKNASVVSVSRQMMKNIASESSLSIFDKVMLALLGETFASCDWNSGIALYDPDEQSACLIGDLCQSQSIPILKITSSRATAAADKSWVYLNVRMTSLRSAKRALKSFQNIIDFSTDKVFTCSDLAVELGTGFHVRHISANILDSRVTPALALEQAMNAGCSWEADICTTLDIRELDTHFHPSPFLALGWSRAGSIDLDVHPAGLQLSFPPNKSYLLVGLTGELGESIARYMFEHGARHFTISSRNPSKNIDWVRDLNERGASVQVRAMNVFLRTDAERVRDEMLSAGIPIGGVINGAMVLSDGLFESMSLESFQTAMRPKAEGSAILDQVFNMPDLDLFIFLSSLSCIVGNPGQSNYAAANMYMVGLAAQRRKRNLAASCLDIGMMMGIGFVRRSGQEATIYGNLRRQGYLVESEVDFLESFAEAVLASKEGDPHIITGLDRLPLDSSSRYKWYSEPKFSHHSLDRGIDLTEDIVNASESTLQQIRASTTVEDATGIISRAMAAHIEVMLGLSADSLDVTMPLIELGIDSLVAVELRSWVFKETGQDLPVLDIMGDGSVSSISTKLAPSARATVGNGVDAVPTVIVEAASAPVELPRKPIRTQEPPTGADSNFPSSRSSSSMDTIEGLTASSTTSEGSTSISEPDVVQTAPKTLSRQLKTEHWHELLFDTVEDIALAQMRFWNLGDINGTTTDHNVTIAYRLAGEISPARLERAIGLTLARHSIFRSSFLLNVENESGQQAVGHHSRFWLRHEECSNDQETISRHIHASAARPFSIANGDTLHADLLHHGGASYTLVFVYHNIIMDGMSWGVFMEDITSFYSNLELQKSAPGQFTDAVALQKKWLTGEEAQRRRSYWKQELEDAQTSLPLLPMAKVNKRDELSHPPGIIERSMYTDKRVAAAVKQCASECQVSSFHLHLAVMQTIMHLMECNDFALGIMDAGRTDMAHVGTVGVFTDYLPLRFTRDATLPFHTMLANTKAKVFAALGHALPFEIIKQTALPSDSIQDQDTPPFFQVVVNYRLGALRKTSLGGVVLELDTLIESKLPFDMMMTIDEDASEDTLGLTLSMRDYMFGEDALEWFMQLYVRLLEVYARDPGMSAEQALVSVHAGA